MIEKRKLSEALKTIKSHIKNPFFSVILFTTAKDVTNKVNKKGVATLSEMGPPFSDIAPIEKD